LIYNATTVIHFLAGAAMIFFGYDFAPTIALSAAALYAAFAFVEMYIVMPLSVCPNCVYFALEGSLCVSGLNIFSRRIAREGRRADFENRAKGILCPNNLYVSSLALPIVAGIPALLFSFSLALLALLLLLVGLLTFRFFVIFPRIACLHCYGKFQCPQAGAMGVRER
jgi:hypothetical protein